MTALPTTFPTCNYKVLAIPLWNSSHISENPFLNVGFRFPIFSMPPKKRKAPNSDIADATKPKRAAGAKAKSVNLPRSRDLPRRGRC